MERQIIAPGTLEFEGKKYAIQFDFEAIAEAEDLTDRPLLMGLTRRQVNQPTINFVRAMFYAGVHRHQPELQYSALAKLVTRENIGELWNDLLAAWVDSRQQEAGEEQTGPTPAAQTPQS